MIDDALSSASSVKFDGKDAQVSTTDSMAEVSQSITEKKIAIRQSLEDIQDEMGIKHEKKVAALQAAADAKLTQSSTMDKKKEDKPKVSEKPKEAEKPKIEEKPKAQEKKVEEKPKAEEKPKV